MKYILALVLLASFSCSTLKNKKIEDQNYFNVEIEQNGVIIKPINGVITLDKSSFKFNVSLDKTDNVYVSSSWDKYYYDYPLSENIFKCADKNFFKECRFIAVKTGNQTKFNADKELFVGDGSYQWNWFYIKAIKWHRFDKGVKEDNGKIKATMTIENIYDLDRIDEGKGDGYEYSIDKIDKDIYMVFAASFYEKGMESPNELQRQKIVLKFK